MMASVAARLRRFAANEDAQNLVEFALLLPVLMYILMGIIQFGLIFNSYVTLSSAVREGARAASVYVYDGTITLSANDAARQNAFEDATIAARGTLNMGSSRSTGTNNMSHSGFASGGCATNGACTVTDGDITMTYSIPTGVTANDARHGYQMAVEAYYHENLFVPLLYMFFPADPAKGASWLRLAGRITVVLY